MVQCGGVAGQGIDRGPGGVVLVGRGPDGFAGEGDVVGGVRRWSGAMSGKFCIDLYPEGVIKFSKFANYQIFQDIIRLLQKQMRNQTRPLRQT